MDAVSPEPIVVLMTAADEPEGERIAEMLVAKRLAACVQVLPGMKSIYSYETPEIIALPIAAASEPYLKWLTSSCEGS
jgi:uncharacterized protein involved in tolerance to divalent cations